MRDQPFQFDLYRLNIVDDEALFDFMGKPIRSDGDVAKLLKHAASADFDQPGETPKYTLKWSLREYAEIGSNGGSMLAVTLARSVVEQVGQTVTDRGIENSIIKAEPPGATSIRLFFRMDRHLVAVEYDSVILATQAWRYALHAILDEAAKSLQVRSSLRLEPVPQREEILRVFRSFSKLTRLRLKLRIPNPELSRYTKQLHDSMRDAEIREYVQDMKNPNGLSKKENALPHASVSLAQAGYKDGEVTLEGMRNGKRQKIKTGRKAARGKLDQIRDFVRGASINAKAKETKAVTEAIIEEIDRIAEPPAEAQ